MSLARTTILVVAFTGAFALAVYEGIQVTLDDTQIDQLQQSASQADESARRIRRERNEALHRISAREVELAAAAARAPAVEDSAGTTLEVLNDPAAQRWLADVRRLKQTIAQMPSRAIPELVLLSDEEWLMASQNLKQLDTADDSRKALSTLRSQAKMKLAQRLQDAVRDYAASNGGQLPTDITQLGAVMNPPVPDEMLQRYQLLQSGMLGQVPSNGWLITERVPVDDKYDTRQMIGMQGFGQSNVTPSLYLGSRALEAYSKANEGRRPSSPADLQAFLEAPLDPGDLQAFFQAWQTRPDTLGLGAARMSYRPLKMQ